MLRSAPRRALTLVALMLAMLLAVALFAPLRSVTASQAARATALSSSSSARDDGRTVAAVPTPGPEWLTNQLRGSSTAEQHLAVLLAAVALVVGQWWRRRTHHVRGDRSRFGTAWSASRAPPAFG